MTMDALDDLVKTAIADGWTEPRTGIFSDAAAELQNMTSGLDRLVRVLVNETDIKVDDVPNWQAPDEAVEMIQRLQAENKSLVTVNDELHARIAALEKFRADVLAVDTMNVNVAEKWKYTKMLIDEQKGQTK
jgi:phosphoribosyl 1,2-cyclic phosphodiesterase